MGFKFNTSNLAEMQTIEIENFKFTFNPKSTVALQAVKRYVNESKKNTELLEKKSVQIDSEEYKEICLDLYTLTKDTINQLLGKGAYSRIFKDRDADLEEHAQVMQYIFEEMTDFLNEFNTKQAS